MAFIKDLFNFSSQLQFVEEVNGLHQMGGEIPDGFKIPDNDFLGGFQYLGYINNADRHFLWLPFPLHLICPIFTDFEYVFLDYNNPFEPQLIYPENSADITSAYDELSKDSSVMYNSSKFALRPLREINEDNEFDIVAIAGKPYWEQAAVSPVVPGSNKKMKFVCQLMSNGPITAKDKNFKSDDDYYEKLFTELNFWCDGSLKVFFEPKSKIACYFIQNT